MKSKVLTVLLFAIVLLVCSSLADEAASQPDSQETKVEEPKQTTQGGRYCRNRWCCGGRTSFGGCRRYCCRYENGVDVPEEIDEAKQPNQGRGGYCRNRWCCGGYNRHGYCDRYCCRHENEDEAIADNVDDSNVQDVGVTGGGGYGGGGGYSGGSKGGGKGGGKGGCKGC